mmetsp:Transcript_13399/g.31456  ORF Transcript_13399/g.31456 Transcript_13399/m.31456 type:complete len:204 (+) Transcript_13399:332-943(+)
MESCCHGFLRLLILFTLLFRRRLLLVLLLRLWLLLLFLLLLPLLLLLFLLLLFLELLLLLLLLLLGQSFVHVCSHGGISSRTNSFVLSGALSLLSAPILPLSVAALPSPLSVNVSVPHFSAHCSIPLLCCSPQARLSRQSSLGRTQVLLGWSQLSGLCNNHFVTFRFRLCCAPLAVPLLTQGRFHNFPGRLRVRLRLPTPLLR